MGCQTVLSGVIPYPRFFLEGSKPGVMQAATSSSPSNKCNAFLALCGVQDVILIHFVARLHLVIKFFSAHTPESLDALSPSGVASTASMTLIRILLSKPVLVHNAVLTGLRLKTVYEIVYNS